jgi:hypothetical protein
LQGGGAGLAALAVGAARAAGCLLRGPPVARIGGKRSKSRPAPTGRRAVRLSFPKKAHRQTTECTT